MHDTVLRPGRQYAETDSNMDNSAFLSPDAAFVGALPARLWPHGIRRADAVAPPLYITRYAGPRATPPLGEHPFWELTYVLGGEGHVEFADRRFFLAPDAGLLIPPGWAHREHTDHPRWDTLWLGFGGGLPSQLGVAAPLALDRGCALRGWAEQAWLWRQREAGAIGAELDALTEFLVRAFVRLARQDGDAPRQPWLAKVQDYIDHRLDGDLTMAELARVAGCSVGHFQREFRQATGETPLQHVTRRRIETAVLYLRQSGLPVREVAARVGFADPLYFSRIFRRRVGLPPSRLRQSTPGTAPSPPSRGQETTVA